MSVDAGLVADRLDEVRQRIATAGGDPDRVAICAVTKGFDVDAVRAALEAGAVDIGENYAQELTAKADDLLRSPASVAPRWHMIGHVQRNKVRRLATHVHRWHTVDRASLGSAIAAAAPGSEVLVQVNATGEASKAGCPPGEVGALVTSLRDAGLDVRGLMTVGPTDPSVDPRPTFDLVAGLAAGLGLGELSMGMSRDLESAVAAGSTMVRVGTALFGARPRRSPMP